MVIASYMVKLSAWGHICTLYNAHKSYSHSLCPVLTVLKFTVRYPRYELAKKSYSADVMLHLGDQVYNKGEDSDKTLQIFDRNIINFMFLKSHFNLTFSCFRIN